MCRLAIEGLAGLSVSDLEVRRGGPSYTVDTLRSMKLTTPDARLTFIVGADTARTLPSWHEPRELLGLAGLAVAARQGTSQDEVLRALDSLGVQSQPTFLEMPNVAVSSSLVRERVVHGQSVEDLVGAAVASYIAEQGLYRATSPVSA
jgi:nicotinate-nucleotide adenylyltransferase